MRQINWRLIDKASNGAGSVYFPFTLPLLQKLLPHASSSASPERHPIRALILTPTRELAAIQVEDNVKAYSKLVPLRSLVVFGGVESRRRRRR